jgi:hypothetical protein
MCQSRRRQEGSDVDTLALSQPPFKSFLRSLQQGYMLLVEPSYLSCPTQMKVVVSHGPLQDLTVEPNAPLMVVHPQL